MNKPILLSMCGLQCSGKTTKAKELMKKYDFKYLCADDYRELYPHWSDSKVFIELYKQMNIFLSQGKNVIVDVTSIDIETRKLLLDNIKHDCLKYIFVMDTPFEECLDRLQKRNKQISRQVPIEILYKYNQNFIIPKIEEGWDKIIYNSSFTKFDN